MEEGWKRDKYFRDLEWRSWMACAREVSRSTGPWQMILGGSWVTLEGIVGSSHCPERRGTIQQGKGNSL